MPPLQQMRAHIHTLTCAHWQEQSVVWNVASAWGVIAIAVIVHTYPALARLFAGTYDRAMVINHFNCHFRNTILSKQQRGCFLHFSHSILFYFTLLYFYFLSYVLCCFRKCPLVFYAPTLWPVKAICRSVWSVACSYHNGNYNKTIQ